MNKGLAAIMLGQMLARTGFNWRDDGFIVERSDLPKREQMPFSEEEKNQLATLSGKAKKEYLKKLKAKYLHD